MRPTVVIDVVGLTPALIGENTPHISRLVRRGGLRAVREVLPAVTATVQSTFVTGLPPSGHGCVANGWYVRELSEILMWRQSNKLVEGEKVWEAGRRRDPSFTCAKLFWWYNMYSTADYTVTPRPMYPADGRKLPDIYTQPAGLREELLDRGDKKRQGSENDAALRFYQEAIQLLDSQPETGETKREKVKVSISIIGSMAYLSYPEDAIEILQEAEKLSKEVGDEKSLARVYSRLGTYHALKGNPTLGLEYSLRAMEYFERRTKDAITIEGIESIAQSAWEVCNALNFAGDYLKMVDVAGRVLRLLEEQHREKDITLYGANVYSLLSGYCGQALGYLGKFEEGKVVLEMGLENAIELNDRGGLGWVPHMHSLLSYFEGDGDNTVHNAEKGVKAFEEAQFEPAIGIAWSQLGAGYYLLGEYETARDHAEKGLKLQREVGVPSVLPLSYCFLVLIHSALGDLENAKDCAEQALKLSQEFNTKAWEAWAWIVLGSVMGKADPAQIDVGEKHICQGISICEELKTKALSAQGYLSLGELFADAGKKDKAIENLKKAEAMYLEMKLTPRSYWLARTREALDRLELGARVK